MTRYATLIVLILLAALSRLIPHPPNFAPIAAVGLFGAAQFRCKWLAFLAPLAAMLLSDFALGFVVQLRVYEGWMAMTEGFHRGSIVVYATYALITAMGFILRKNRGVPLLVGTSLASSVIFFVVTNFAVWAADSLYPTTLAGLMTCYVAAIPYFQWTVLSDLCYVALLFGCFAWAERHYPSLRLALAPVPNE
jgi:hypothetical protein